MRFVAKVGNKIADCEIADFAVEICCKVKFVWHLVQNPCEISQIAEFQGRRSDFADHSNRVDEFKIGARLFVFKAQVEVGARFAGLKNQVVDIEAFLAEHHIAHSIVEHQSASLFAFE